MERTSTERARLLRVLAAFSRGILGKAHSPEIPPRVLEVLDSAPDTPASRQLFSALKLMDSRLGARPLTGQGRPISGLSAAGVERVLLRWKRSRVAAQRRLYTVITSTTLACLYGFPSKEWDRIGYQGPVGPPPNVPKPLHPMTIERDEVLTCDFVIVGSGAGGGVAAGILAAAGYDVVVLEKGGYRNESDFHHREAESNRDMYLYGLQLTTEDLGVRILAGSTLGGGTVVNYTTSFKTTEPVRREWSRITGIEAFSNGEFEEHLDRAAERVNVNLDSSAAGRRDGVMEDGLKRLGWHVDALPRAVKGCTQDEACGFCGYGCRAGAKQSTMLTWLQDAEDAGARIITGVDARTIRISGSRATGIEARSVEGGYRLVVNARNAVISSCGAIETPALLLRSGLRGEVGHHLHLHPGTGAFGMFDDEVRLWEGTLQARYSAEFRDQDGGYGPIFETVPVHPGTGAFIVPWTSAAGHYEGMEKFRNLGFTAVLPRDQSDGRVSLSKTGAPKVTYRLNDGDHRRLVEGLINGGRVMEAAGATEITTLHATPLTYRPGSAYSHDAWAADVRKAGLRGKSPLFSYHQMSSCRMGTNPATSAIDADNETHEVKDLFVLDASAFPTASGTNPMLTVYGIAHMAATKIAKRYA